MTTQEVKCENRFAQTTRRMNNRRFIVRRSKKILRNSVHPRTSLSRFLQIERKLDRNLKLHKKYSKFIDKYKQLGHTTEIAVKSKSKNPSPHYFPPHHCVPKPESTRMLRLLHRIQPPNAYNSCLHKQCINIWYTWFICIKTGFLNGRFDVCAEVIEKQQQLHKILQLADFKLPKKYSNNEDCLKTFLLKTGHSSWT